MTNDGDQFCSSVFRKKTAVGLFTNYLGFTTFFYKVGLARTLPDCAFMISSSWIILTPFKYGDIFHVKDPVPKSLKSFVVYKFACPGCNACYTGETTRHLSTRIKEHLETDQKSHIFARLVNNETCKALSTENCFEIIDSTSTPFRLKLKEAIHIIWKKPSLNKQQKHVSISITV